MNMATLLGRTWLRVTGTGLGLTASSRPGDVNLGHADDLGRNHAVAAKRARARAHAVLDAARF
jgi:hypothetical protein